MRAVTQKRNYKRSSALVLFAAILSTLAIACSKGGGDSGPVGPGPFYNPAVAPVCGGCPGSGGFLAAAISRSPDMIFGPVEMGLAFYGDPMILAGQTQGYPSGGYLQMGYFGMYPSQTYRGPVSARGYIILPMGLPVCGLPPGRYNLDTQSPGIWGNDGAGRSGENIGMMLLGSPIPTAVFLSGYTVPVTPPIRGQDGSTYPFKFTTTQLVFKRADGPYCQLWLE